MFSIVIQKKIMNNRETLQKRVYFRKKKNRPHGKKLTINHFLIEGVSKSTFNDILSFKLWFIAFNINFKSYKVDVDLFLEKNKLFQAELMLKSSQFKHKNWILDDESYFTLGFRYQWKR